MYSAFDSFCTMPTWDTVHALDERRFDAALAEVANDPSFCPIEMGRYIRDNHATPVWPKSDAEIDAAIQRLVARASEFQRRQRVR